jgi:hypothetical protein
VPESVPDYIAIIDRLIAEDVRFVLIGGLAMIAHGSSRLTFDVDVTFARDRGNVARLAAALSNFSPRPRDFPDGLPFVWDTSTLMLMTNSTLVTSVGEVDLLGEPAGASDFEALYRRSIEMEIFGRKVRVASLDDLEAMKRAVGRAKDLDHLRDIQALRELRDES